MAGFADPLCRCPGLSPGSGAAGGPLWRSGRGAGQRGSGLPQASASPAGEQPGASLPLHVLPLYSLLAPEEQAQVTVRGRGWKPGAGRPQALRWEQVRPRSPSPSAVRSAPQAFERVLGSPTWRTGTLPSFSSGAVAQGEESHLQARPAWLTSSDL